MNICFHTLESDIDQLYSDFFIIDPILNLHYEKNTSRTTGEDASNTSQKLRALTRRQSVVTVVITQSDVKKSEGGDESEGTRELQLPSRDEVRKTEIGRAHV